MTLPTITYDDLMAMGPCWACIPEKKKLLESYAARKERWSALDILNLPESECSKDDKLWAVLREDLIPAKILHEFACRCAERALSRVDNPDPRIIAAIDAKRKWLLGEIDDDALCVARNAALHAARNAARNAERNAASAAMNAALHAARSATLHAALDAESDAERRWQAEELMRMLTEEAG